MSYQYRGKIHDASEPIPKIISTPGVFNGEKCGSTAGYKQHKELDVPACQDCREALTDYHREYRAKRRAGAAVRTGFNPDKCGTYAGYHRHGRSDVPACEPCEQANTDYMINYRAGRKVAA